jgi:hypothetical protein
MDCSEEKVRATKGLLAFDSEEAAILALRGKDGHFTNMIEHRSFSQKYLPFLPFDSGFPQLGHSTIFFPQT